MSNEKNHDLNNLSSDNYIIELPEKKGFFSSAIESIKKIFTPKDEIKYFPLKDSKPKITGRSISSLWIGGTLKAVITTALDKARKSILKPQAPKVTNGFKTEIIGGKSQDTPDISKEESPIASQNKNIIFHQTEKFKAKGIIDNSKTAAEIAAEAELSDESLLPNPDIEQDSTNSEKVSAKSKLSVSTIDSSAISQPATALKLESIIVAEPDEIAHDESNKELQDR